MEKTLFDKNGEAVAYVTNDYNETIYLWEGSPVAYLYEDAHVYGINGRHLGWFVNGILYNNNGKRIGFTSNTSPVPITKEPVKTKKQPMYEIRPRWSAPPFPQLTFDFATEALLDFLKEGEVALLRGKDSSKESPD